MNLYFFKFFKVIQKQSNQQNPVKKVTYQGEYT